MDNKNKKNIIFLSISTIVLLVMFFLAILPSISNIKKIAGEINSEIDSLKLKSSEGQSIEKDISKLSEIKKSEEIKNSFVIKNEEVSFIKKLEDAAKKLHLSQTITIEKITRSSKKTVIDDKEIPVTIKLHGTYYSLLRYLSFLEKSSYCINIDYLSFNHTNETVNPFQKNTDNETGESSQLNLTIRAKVFRNII